jgi:MFS family permease
MGYAAYSFAMLSVRLFGNLIFTRYTAHQVLPLVAGVASVGFAGGLLINQPFSVLLGFALLGAGLGCVVPMIFSIAGTVENVDTGRSVAAVSGFGWAGFVVGPVVIGEVASVTTLHIALFLIPALAGIVAVATGMTKTLRRSTVVEPANPVAG